MKLIALALAGLLPLAAIDDESEVVYTVTEEGPRTVYSGVVKLKWDQNTTACVEHEFPLVPGRLSGPSISSNPGQPMLPFDEVQIYEDSIYISWERERTDLQPNPVECHRRFIFHIIKTKFNADDLGKLLSDWGPPVLIDMPWPEQDYTRVSPWDLNADNYVDGKDLSILLGGWTVE